MDFNSFEVFFYYYSYGENGKKKKKKMLPELKTKIIYSYLCLHVVFQ